MVWEVRWREEARGKVLKIDGTVVPKSSQVTQAFGPRVVVSPLEPRCGSGSEGSEGSEGKVSPCGR